MKKAWIISLIILLNAPAVWSEAPNIAVVGLFSNQAVLLINNKQRLLKVGKTSPEGVKLISATSQNAVLEFEGVQKEYFLSSQVGANFGPPPAQAMVSLWPTNGMYLTPGSINGYSIDFLVDTGASSIAINAATAKRIGVDYLKGDRIGVKTAASIEVAYKVTLDNVQVGDITLYNIGAVVLDGPEPTRALLGMSFLGQLDMKRIDDRMDLQKRF